MGNIVIAFTFVMIMNVLMFLTQAAILDVNPDGTDFYHYEGSMLESYGGANQTLTSSGADQLPASTSSVSPTSSNIFTDIFNTLLSWIKSAPGINYLYAMVSAPYNILKTIGLPSEVSFALGAFWYGITILITVAFLTGRD